MSQMDDVLREYRLRLASRDASLQLEYARRWRRIEAALEAQYLNLALDAADAEVVTASQVWALERYQSLIAQSREEMTRFASSTGAQIEAERAIAAQDGLDMGADAITAQFARVGVDATFTRLPLETIQSMIGMAGRGTPLAQLLTASYPQTVDMLTQALINAIALGYNPRKTARMMADAMTGNLQRALLISRTEQMRAFRTAQVQQFSGSGVVNGYRRRASLSSRTCLACLMEDGRIYTNIEQYSDHPAGRCSAEPILLNYKLEPAQTGRQYFQNLSGDAQREIMGDGHYKAWKAGEFSLSDVSRIHNHPTWGESPQVVPLKELIHANG